MAGITAIKRKGFKGGGSDASTTSFSQSFDRQMGNKPGTTKGNPDSDRREREGQGAADRTNQTIANRAAIREQIKKQELEKSNIGAPKKNFNVFDFGKNYIRNRKKGLYNMVPNNPKRELEFLSSLQITDPARYNRLPQSLKNLLDAKDKDGLGFSSYKDYPKLSYDDFESLTQFDEGAFAKYARDRGSPGLSVSGDMSQVGMKSVQKDQFGNPVKDMFGNTLFNYGTPGRGGDGGQQSYLPIDYNTGAATTEDVVEDTNDFSYRMGGDQNVIYDDYGTSGYRTTAAEGGIMGTRARRAMGGIMNRVDQRQGYFLGKIVKGVKSAVGGVVDATKKVLKSDVGKMALAGAAFMYGPKLFGAESLGGFGGYGQLVPKIAGNKFLSGALLNSGKDGFNPFKVAGIAGLGALSLFGREAKQDPSIIGDRGGRLKDSQGNDALPADIRAEIREAYASGDSDRINAIQSYYNFLPGADAVKLPSVQPYLPYPNYAEGGRIGFNLGGSSIKLLDGTVVKIPSGAFGKEGLKDIIYSSSKGDLTKDEIVPLLVPAGASYSMGGRIGKAEGGLMDLGGMEKDYRAEGGFVPIGEYEKKDDVPARLSVNEFVFTADAVRGAGQGDIDKGAEIMENMMENLENGGTVSEESQGNKGAQNMFKTSERLGAVI